MREVLTGRLWFLEGRPADGAGGQPYNGDTAGHYFIDTDISPEDEAQVCARPAKD